MEVDTRAVQLRRGDYLPGSRQHVARSPQLSRDKRVELTVVTRHDVVRHVSWNSRTTMRIYRPDERELPEVLGRLDRILAAAKSATEAAGNY